MRYIREQGIIRILVGLILMLATGRFANAGDFAIVADLDNGTIYAGSMARRLADFVPLPLSGVHRPLAVDYDPVEKMVYWSDLQSTPFPAISRAHLKGGNQQTIVDDLGVPDGLALDVVSRTLYWTDVNFGHIGRISMDGRGNKEIIVDNIDKPRAIVTDHERGHIYWTDWGSNPRIERADLDGNNRTVLVEGDLYWPNGVAIDFKDKYLYWCDAKLDKIERSDLSGNNRELLINLTSYDVLHPFDLAVYSDYVYWTDWAVSTVVRVNDNGQGEQNFGPEVFERAGGIHIEEEPNYCDSSPCDNGAPCIDVVNGYSCQCLFGFQGINCSDRNCDSKPCVNGGTCISAPDGFTCQCPTGYEGPTCAQEPDFCESFPCDNSATCVNIDQGFSCQCPHGFQGMTCSDRNCASKPCTNGGTCSSTTDGFTCQCLIGYEGPTCAIIAGCVPPPSSSHVTLVEGDVQLFQPGEETTFVCDNGYTITGSADHSARRICQSDGTWSDQSVECSLAEEGNPAPVGAIVGGAVGGLILLFAVLSAAFILIKRQRIQNRRERAFQDPAVATVSSNEMYAGAPPSYVSSTRPYGYTAPVYQESVLGPTVQHTYHTQIVPGPISLKPLPPTGDSAPDSQAIYMEMPN